MAAHADALTHDAVVRAVTSTTLPRQGCRCGQQEGIGATCTACRSSNHLRWPDGGIGGTLGSPVLLDGVQPKLTVSRPGDRYEEEADAVAAAVMRRADSAKPAAPLHGRAGTAVDDEVQRQADDGDVDEEEEDEQERGSIQTRGMSTASPPPAAVATDRVGAHASAGEPLAAEVRQSFEARFGQDFSTVRVHADAPSARLARDLRAKAFTHGQHVYFGAGQYQPHTAVGQELLAHELTHTLQQRGGTRSPVANWVQRRASAVETPAPPSTRVAIQSHSEEEPTPPEGQQVMTTERVTSTARTRAEPGPSATEPTTTGPQTPAAPQAAVAPNGAPAAPSAPGESGPGLQPATTLDTQSEGALLQSLATVPLSAFGPAMDQVGPATAAMQQRERSELTATLPVIDRPTGLAGGPKQPEQPGADVAEGRPPEPERAPPREQPPPATSHEGTTAALPAAAVQSHVEEPAEDAGGSWWDWIFNAVARFLHRLPTTDANLETSAGARPHVDTTGEADPARADAQRQATGDEVNARRAEGDAATQGDFGEHNIYPDQPTDQLRPNYTAAADGESPTAEARRPGAVAPVVMAGFDRSGAGWLRGEVDQRVEQERQDRVEHDQGSEAARTDSQRQIDDETERVRAEQLDVQSGARHDVIEQRERWREENRQIQQTYGDEATSRQRETTAQIDDQVRTTEVRADEELSRAEEQAEQKRQETERQAEEKKREAENRPRSFWDRVKGAVSDFFDALKEAVNALFDALRAFVREVIERAKRLVRDLIEAARAAIVGFIRAFGEVLKGIASVALAAFPATAERARQWIDRRVDGAVDAVNRAADALQQFAQRVLDALGAALDFILSVYQRAYLLLLDGLRLLAVGLIEIMEKIGHLVTAAGEMPDHFLGQASDELIGQDLTKPLAFELTAPRSPAASIAAATASGQLSPRDATALTRTAFPESEATVDRVAPLDLDPGFLAELNLRDGEDREFGESSDPTRTIAAVQQEAAADLEQGPAAPTETEAVTETTGATPAEAEPSGSSAGVQEAAEEPAAAAAPLGAEGTTEDETERRLQTMMDAEPEPRCPKEASGSRADESAVPEESKFGPLTVGQRARYLLNQMIKGVRNWLSCNWPWLVAAAVGVLTVLVVAEILTGGAITAALPPLMQVIAAVMLGVAAVRMATYIGEYLSKGWEGDIPGSSRSLARGLAIGAIELVFTLLFDLNAVIKAVKQGFTATLRGAATAARRAGRTLARSASRIGRAAVRTARAPGRAGALVGRVVVRRGRMVFQGVRAGFARGARSLDDLARRLWNTVRFRRFKLVRRGLRIQLWGYINPWVLLADGSVVQVAEHELPAGAKVGSMVDVPSLAGRPPRPGLVLSMTEDIVAADAEALLRHVTSQPIREGANFLEHFTKHHELLEGVLGRRFFANPAGHAEFLAELTRLVRSGEFRPIGLTHHYPDVGTLAAFEGTFRRVLPDGQVRFETLRLFAKPDGEWFTLLRVPEEALESLLRKNLLNRLDWNMQIGLSPDRPFFAPNKGRLVR